MLRYRSLIFSNKRAIIAPYSEQLENKMYSPRIDKHTPTLYRLAQATSKPMTKVADEVLSYGFKHLNKIYALDDECIDKILNEVYEEKFK